MSPAAEGRLAGAQRLLYAGPFLTMLDRFSIAPLLVPIAVDFRRPLSEVAILASLYFFVYGLFQVGYGLLSDRFGRVRIIRITLAGMAAAGLISAVAPTFPVLVAGRVLTGAFASAVMPASLVYLADTFAFRVRQQAVSSLLAAVALGTTAASVGAGVVARYSSWRVTFLIPAAGALILTTLMRRLPESIKPGAGEPALGRLASVMSRPWPAFVNLFALLEGAAMLGFFTFLAPALQARGVNSATAGAVTAGYGVAVLGWTRLMRRFAARIPAQWLIFGGGAMLVGGYGTAAVVQSIPSILAAAILAGGAYAVMHSTFQTWATEVAPDARGTSTALFATGAFIGAGLGTWAVSGLAGSHDFGRLFLVAAAASLPMVVVGGLARRRYTSALPARDRIELFSA